MEGMDDLYLRRITPDEVFEEEGRRRLTADELTEIAEARWEQEDER